MRGGITSARGGVVFGIVTLRGAVEFMVAEMFRFPSIALEDQKDVLSGNFYLTMNMGIEV